MFRDSNDAGITDRLNERSEGRRQVDMRWTSLEGPNHDIERDEFAICRWVTATPRCRFSLTPIF
jgi:hypothetical protein